MRWPTVGSHRGLFGRCRRSPCRARRRLRGKGARERPGRTTEAAALAAIEPEMITVYRVCGESKAALSGYYALDADARYVLAARQC